MSPDHSRRLYDAAARTVPRRIEELEREGLWVIDFEHHEALLNLAVVKGHRDRFVAADWWKLSAA